MPVHRDTGSCPRHGAAEADRGGQPLTVVRGRATRLEGGVYLVLLAAFIFLPVNP